MRVGNWLMVDQSRNLLAKSNGDDLRSKRNYAMLAFIVGCGLRRGELLSLNVRSIQIREEHGVVADLLGKAGHIRTIPIPTWVKMQSTSGLPAPCRLHIANLPELVIFKNAVSRPQATASWWFGDNPSKVDCPGPPI